jgi:glycosyltransferase involved in cell wall biosynthesis
MDVFRPTHRFRLASLSMLTFPLSNRISPVKSKDKVPYSTAASIALPKASSTGFPTVSVVIPAYNALKFLPQTIASVIAQTFQDFELLLIDDGSSDGTADWVAQYNQGIEEKSGSPEHKIRFFQQHRGGVSAARNLGIQNAQGEFVAFLDADDLWVPSKLAQQVNYLSQHPRVGLVHGAIALMDETGRLTGRVLSSKPAGSSLPRLLTQNAVACQTVMIRRSCFEQSGGFDSQADTVEDWDLWIRVARFYPIVAMNEVLAHYRQVESSLSRSHERMVPTYHYVIEKSYEFCQDELTRLGVSDRRLKATSYASAYQCLAWKAIQCKFPDIQQSNTYRRRALHYRPDLVLTGEYWRLWAAILLKTVLPPSRYQALKVRLYGVRSKFGSASKS